MSKPTESLWRGTQFRAYLGSTALSGMGLSMQPLLLNWMLIGVLLLPADQVGLIQALIGIPGVFLILIGGAKADRADPRNFLIVTYLVAPIFPIFLILMDHNNQFAVWSVVIWGLGISFVQSYSAPAQQAILNRVAGSQVQQGVTAATILGFVVQVIALGLAGQMDRIGIAPVLMAQALSIGLAAWSMTGLNRVELPLSRSKGSALQGILEGLRETYRSKIVFHVLVINFVSSIFNAGSFMTVFPFVVKRVYDGDALMLSALMAVFFFGAAISNAILLRFMPLRRAGRLFLLMQLSRIVVLWMIYVEGGWWLFVLGTFGWGLNMGITSNLARTIVQESAEPEFRGRILSIFTIGLVGSAPIGAIVLGELIERMGTLNALWPAMILSGLLCAYGAWWTDLWRHES